jgi:spindle assembly abnormal protein 6
MMMRDFGASGEETSSSAGLELMGGSFEGTIPVRIKHNDLDERQAQLTLRLSVEAEKPARGSHKVLRFRLTDEADAFLLHTLDVNEEDFAQLKQEQRLLVDFTAFPSKLVELLEHTREAAASPHPRFVVTLASSQGGSVLSVVEANNFRQLVHISLQLRAGTDTEVKRYLAGRVKGFKAEVAELGSSLAESRAQLRQTAAQAASAEEEVRTMREERQRTVSELEQKASAALTAEREKALAAQRELQTSLDAEYRAKLRAREEENTALRAQLDVAQREGKELTDEKYRLEGTVHELQVKLGSATKQATELQSELDRTRDQNRLLDAASHDATKTINGDNVRIATIEQQLRDKAETLKKMEALLESCTSQKTQLEDTVALLKGTVDKYDQKVKQSIAEIHKGNGYIEQLSGELGAARQKIKLKAAVVKQQQLLLTEKEQNHCGKELELSSLRTELTNSQAALSKAEATIASKETRLKESEELLQSNQQVITWLNKEINEAQLGRSSAASRAASAATTFRPTVHSSARAGGLQGGVSGSGGAASSYAGSNMATPPRFNPSTTATGSSGTARAAAASVGVGGSVPMGMPPQVQYRGQSSRGGGGGASTAAAAAAAGAGVGSSSNLLAQMGAPSSLRDESAVAPFVGVH